MAFFVDSFKKIASTAADATTYTTNVAKSGVAYARDFTVGVSHASAGAAAAGAAAAATAVSGAMGAFRAQPKEPSTGSIADPSWQLPIRQALKLLTSSEASSAEADDAAGRLSAEGQQLVLSLMDNGNGFPPRPKLEYVFTDTNQACADIRLIRKFCDQLQALRKIVSKDLNNKDRLAESCQKAKEYILNTKWVHFDLVAELIAFVDSADNAFTSSWVNSDLKRGDYKTAERRAEWMISERSDQDCLQDFDISTYFPTTTRRDDSIQDIRQIQIRWDEAEIRETVMSSLAISALMPSFVLHWKLQHVTYESIAKAYLESLEIQVNKLKIRTSVDQSWTGKKDKDAIVSATAFDELRRQAGKTADIMSSIRPEKDWSAEQVQALHNLQVGARKAALGP